MAIMGEMADVSSKPMQQSRSVLSQLSVDAEPESPRQPYERFSNNFYSTDLSQDAIAGVPPRSIRRAAPISPRDPAVPQQYPLQQPFQARGPPFPQQSVPQPVRGQERNRGSLRQQDDISVRNARSQPMEVGLGKNIHDEEDDSSYGSYLSSVESGSSLSDWESELEKFKDKMPAEIRESYYDAVILYTEDDREKAEKFRQHLITEIKLPNKEPVLALLYDCAEFQALSGSQIQHLDHAMERSTYIFVYLTEKFVKDKWCEFSSESCLMRAIYSEEKRWCVVPVYTQRRTDCKFKIPMGLNSLKGINYYSNDEFYRKGVARLIGDKVAERKKLQELHKIKQKEWLEKYKRDLIKVEEQKRRMALQEEMETREFGRKVGYLPDSELFNNLQAKMHNSFSESQLSHKQYPMHHSASMGSMKGIPEPNPAVQSYIQEYIRKFKYTTQQSYTPEQVEILSRIVEQENNSISDPLSGKFQGLNIQSQHSQTSGYSADIGIRSEAEEEQGDDVELHISPENYRYLNTLNPAQQQFFLESLHTSQEEQRQVYQSCHMSENQGGRLLSGPCSFQTQTNCPANAVPNFDLISVRSHQPSLQSRDFSERSGDSSVSSGSYSGGSSWAPRPEMTSSSYPRTMEPSQGNVPTHLMDDNSSMVFEDSGSMPAEQDQNGWTLVDHDQVPRIPYNKAEKSSKQRKVGKKHGKAGDAKEIEMLEKTNKEGQIVHQHIYHIYNPRAVQIGDENVVQDAGGNTQEDKSDPDSDLEAEVKVHNRKTDKDKRTRKKKELPAESDEEIDSIETVRPPGELVGEQIHGEITDGRHNSGGIVAMDAAPSSAGSFSHMISTGVTTGHDEYKNDLSAIREEAVSGSVERQSEPFPTAANPSLAVQGNHGVKPKLPIKPLPRRDQASAKHTNDTDQTFVKPSKIFLPVKPTPKEDASDQSENSPSIVRKIFEKPMAKIGPSIFKNNNDEENTDLKTVINSEETAVKYPYGQNNVSEETLVKTVFEPPSSSDTEKAVIQHIPEQISACSGDSSPKRSIQSLMPQVRPKEAIKIEKDEVQQGHHSYQARPFSITRHSDASKLFYRNTFDTLELNEGAVQDNSISIDDSEAESINSVNQFGTTNESGLIEVQPGEDPLTRDQGRKNPSLLVKDHGTEV